MEKWLDPRQRGFLDLASNHPPKKGAGSQESSLQKTSHATCAKFAQVTGEKRKEMMLTYPFRPVLA